MAGNSVDILLTHDHDDNSSVNPDDLLLLAIFTSQLQWLLSKRKWGDDNFYNGKQMQEQSESAGTDSNATSDLALRTSLAVPKSVKKTQKVQLRNIPAPRQVVMI